ncbi:hypothetical protein LO771_23415 [Streptacidiphilus sp. ASG 303]|uniref:hypothetical protein n=1 Tax=Streptacidiphilus sp. ASG 303 TaxID=2896847 RepID=UPI001E573D50|nr:hypothetical protein [Streptacidiphilus sp. ASG 303]MCD0485252.1 hypothetical protein [Streptacidiphilus sp. ASG 303]
MTADRAPAAPTDAPRPEPVRFFGTSWADRGPGYALRRAAVAAGALAALAAGLLALSLALSAFTGGPLLDVLLAAAVGGCSLMAGLRTWRTLSRGRDALDGWMADDRALAPIMVVGFAGTLAAYAVRSLVEAPGEGVARARHEAALAAHARRRTPRGGRPGARRAPGGRRPRR